MSRPPNPYRDEHRRLESLGNEASGRGEHATAMYFWRRAAELKIKGVEEVDAVMKARKKETK